MPALFPAVLMRKLCPVHQLLQHAGAAHLIRPVQGDLHAAALGLSSRQRLPASLGGLHSQLIILRGPLLQQGVQAGGRPLWPGQLAQGAVLQDRGQAAVAAGRLQAAGGGLAVLGRGLRAQGLDLGRALPLGVALVLRGACEQESGSGLVCSVSEKHAG